MIDSFLRSVIQSPIPILSHISYRNGILLKNGTDTEHPHRVQTELNLPTLDLLLIVSETALISRESAVKMSLWYSDGPIGEKFVGVTIMTRL